MAYTPELQAALKDYNAAVRNKSSSAADIKLKRDELLKQIDESYGPGKPLDVGEATKILSKLSKEAGKAGLTSGILFKLPSGRFVDTNGTLATQEQLDRMAREQAAQDKLNGLIEGTVELVTPEQMAEKQGYTSEDANAFISGKKQALSLKTRRGRLASAAIIGGAVVVAAVSGGLAIPALVGVGGAIASLGTGAAAVATGLGVTGVSTVVAAAAAGGWATNEYFNSRDPEIMMNKNFIKFAKHDAKMLDYEGKLRDAYLAHDQKLIERYSKYLQKETEKGLKLNKKYTAKVNRQLAWANRTGAIYEWLGGMGMKGLLSSHDAKIQNLKTLKEQANAQMGYNITKAVRLNDEFPALKIKEGRRFKEFWERKEKVGIMGREVGRDVAEYNELHSRVMEEHLQRNAEEYAKLGSWEEVKNKLQKDLNITGIAPRTEAKLLLGNIGKDIFSAKVRAQMAGQLINSDVLRNAVKEMRETGVYDADLAKLLKGAEIYFTGKKPADYDAVRKLIDDENTPTKPDQTVKDWEVEHGGAPVKPAGAEITAPPKESAYSDPVAYNKAFKEWQAWDTYRKDKKEYDDLKKSWTKYNKFADANAIKEPELDAAGNPVHDKKGNPKMKVVKSWEDRVAENQEYHDKKADYDNALNEVETMRPKGMEDIDHTNTAAGREEEVWIRGTTKPRSTGGMGMTHS